LFLRDVRALSYTDDQVGELCVGDGIAFDEREPSG
jgi:hypothetical protein